jgi:large exoprotein involved in heme utilization and adhesion
LAQAYGLRPGIALAADQVAHLTSDIVWMESQQVCLPDGTVESVLVPKVYLAHVGDGVLRQGGALFTNILRGTICHYAVGLTNYCLSSLCSWKVEKI